MKKTLATIVLLFAMTISAMAQTTADSTVVSIYQEIVKMSNEVANDKSKNIEVRKIATFKSDALFYMAMRMGELMPDSTIMVLDNQEIALYTFIHLFQTKIGRSSSDKERQKILTLFQNASFQFSRFNDMDYDLVRAYCKGDKYITRFSLDTDWVKALAYVRKELGLD